jgi:hypothetical protein
MTVKTKNIRLPSKRSINLATASQKKVNYRALIPALAIVTVAVLVFTKFAVIDRIVTLTNAEKEVESIQQQIDAGYIQIAGFGDLVEKYAHYTYSDMTPEELSLVDRNAIIAVMDRVLFSRIEVEDWTIKGNTLSVNVAGKTLEEVNKVSQSLLEEPSVEYCTVKTAATDDRNSMWDESSDTEMLVYSQIIVYFINVTEETGEGVTEG